MLNEFLAVYICTFIHVIFYEEYIRFVVTMEKPEIHTVEMW